MSDLDEAAGDDNANLDDQFLDDAVDDEGGLFGSGSEGDLSDAGSPRGKLRKLDDSELDSGDDDGRKDRVEQRESDGEVEKRDLRIYESEIGRHPAPHGSDGELYSLRFPDTVGINPKAFTLEGFEPPTTEHHTTSAPPSSFSAFNTSINTIRFRQSPGDPSSHQSNARILRWSDGSLTLQLASNPLQQYLLTAKPLNSPQVNPELPTPTSIHIPNAPRTTNYNPAVDSHEYLSAPHEHVGLIRNTSHFTTALTVQSSEQDDEALLKLQESLAAATRGNKASADGGPEVINITEDPELAKKRAEVAEKEKSRMQRKMQARQEKENSRANNVLRRSGLRTGGMGGGLTVGGLEDDEMGMGRSRGTKAPRKPRRRNSEYSEDEEDYRRSGRTKEDEYELDDGFLVGSDEDIEEDAVEDEEEDEDLDAEGEDDDEVAAPKKSTADSAPSTNGGGGGGGGRLKNKRVIDDEDEE